MALLVSGAVYAQSSDITQRNLRQRRNEDFGGGSAVEGADRDCLPCPAQTLPERRATMTVNIARAASIRTGRETGATVIAFDSFRRHVANFNRPARTATSTMSSRCCATSGTHCPTCRQCPRHHRPGCRVAGCGPRNRLTSTVDNICPWRSRTVAGAQGGGPG